jgi:hypothetical protein
VKEISNCGRTEVTIEGQLLEAGSDDIDGSMWIVAHGSFEDNVFYLTEKWFVPPVIRAIFGE